MAKPTGSHGTGMDEFYPWDGYIVIFTVFVVLIVSTGALLWLLRFLKGQVWQVWNNVFGTREQVGIQQIMQQISGLDKKDRQVLRSMMTQIEFSETSPVNDIDAHRQQIHHLKLEIDKLIQEKTKIEKRIAANGETDFNVYVTKSGTCWHLDAGCSHLKQSSIRKTPCQHCAR